MNNIRKKSLIITAVSFAAFLLVLILYLLLPQGFWVVKTESTLSRREKELLQYSKPNPSQPSALDFVLLEYMGVDNADLVLLSKTPNATILALNDNANLNDEAIPCLRYVEKVTTLNVSQTHISENLALGIDHLIELQDLSVGYRAYPQPEDMADYPLFTDKFVENLSNKKLRTLYVYRNCKITDQGLQLLRKFPELETVVLHSPDISKQGVDDFLANYPYAKARYTLAPPETKSYKLEIKFSK